MSAPDSTPLDRTVRQQAVATGLAFLMAESIRRHDRNRRKRDAALMIHLRDSLSYRAEAVLWHPAMLRVLQSTGTRRLRDSRPNTLESHGLLLQVASEHHFLFDDLVFNSLSLFDYVGNSVGFSLYGERRRKAKWARIQRYAADPAFEQREHPATRISSSALGACILGVYAKLVKALTEYRAALIHYEAQLGPGESRFEFKNAEDGQLHAEYTLLLRVPQRFARLFVVPGYESDPSQATLIDAADWLARETTQESTRVLRALERELRIEAGVSPDGTDGTVEIVA